METLSQTILSLEQRLLERHTRGNAETLAALLHDDFEELGATGQVCTKAQAIQWLLREDDNIRWSLSQFRIKHLAPTLVLAIYCAHKLDLISGRIKNSQRSSIWIKTDSSWAMLFHQGTDLVN